MSIQSENDKSVFISYRRAAAAFIALSVFKDLRNNGYDVFMDTESLSSGTFDTVLLNQIASRTHFIIILAPGTVERCVDQDDWVRREIEYAMNMERNIIPLLVSGFTFAGTEQYLTGRLSNLKRYNGIPVTIEFFDEAMARLRTRFIGGEQKASDSGFFARLFGRSRSESPPIPPVISTTEQEIIKEQVEEIASQPTPTKTELTAENLFGQGYSLQEAGDLDLAIIQYNEAIKLNPSYRRAYYNRGLAYHHLEDYEAAKQDYEKALEIEPTSVKAHNNLGLIWYELGEYKNAIKSFTTAIALDPDHISAYRNRASAYRADGNDEAAEADEEVIAQYEKRNRIDDMTEEPEPYEMQPDASTRPLAAPSSPLLDGFYSVPLKIGRHTDTGMVRQNNQDACNTLVFTSQSAEDHPDFGLAIVADGMGGHHDGEKASTIAVRVITTEILTTVYMPMFSGDNQDELEPISELLIAAVQKANAAILEGVPEGGSTVTAVVIVGDLAHFAHAGDTRAYLLSKDGIDQITRDHSLVQRLIELEQITPEEAENHPQKNVLYRALGQNETLEVDTLTRRLPANARLLLCSDGLWDIAEESELYEIVMNHNDPQQAAEKLVALANSQGGVDNITAVVIHPPS